MASYRAPAEWEERSAWLAAGLHGRSRWRLAAVLGGALHDHRRRMLADGNAGADFVFCDSTGGPLRRQNVLRRSWRPLLKRAELPETTRLHDLQHSAATLLLTAGVHPKVVQERLGHSDIRVTLDVYSHVLPTLQREAADVLDRQFRRSGS